MLPCLLPEHVVAEQDWAWIGGQPLDGQTHIWVTQLGDVTCYLECWPERLFNAPFATTKAELCFSIKPCSQCRCMRLMSHATSIAAREACRRTRLALRRKVVSSARSGSSTGLRSRSKDDWAMDAKAFTAVSLVISLRKRSRSTCVVHTLCKPFLLQETGCGGPLKPQIYTLWLRVSQSMLVT